jgi:hypothetical protein
MLQTKNTKQSIRVRPEVLVSLAQWSLLFLALAVYIYFIALSVFQVVLRQELMVSIQEAETRVSQLESTYFESANKISQEMATEYGLVAVASPVYLTVSSNVGLLTRSD